VRATTRVRTESTDDCTVQRAAAGTEIEPFGARIQAVHVDSHHGTATGRNAGAHRAPRELTALRPAHIVPTALDADKAPPGVAEAGREVHGAMNTSVESQHLKLLEQRAEELIRLCVRMDQEIRTLKAAERMLREERAQLLRKNEDARSKVEAMILRLRSLEQES
jgi:cell division protein ZapB